MKELSVEQKARRYDEALAMAKECITYIPDEAVNKYMLNMFPELKESDGERIRKQIISFLKEFEHDHYRSLDFSSWIAWLEKQGQQNSNVIWHDVSEEPEKYRELLCEWYAKGDINHLTPFHDIAFYHRSDKTFWNGKQQIENVIKWAYLDEMYDEHSQSYLAPKSARQVINEEIIDNANKVEPKFKDGQWIVFNGLTLYINEVVKGYYRTTSKGGIPNSYDWNIDNAARLWTIKDARDGDVLVSCVNKPFIYNGKFTEITVGAYCGIDIYGNFIVKKYIKECNWTNNDDIRPATKEQRDKLKKAMLKAGYKWNADKKELIKL